MSSKSYWAKREAEALQLRITDEKEYDRQIKRIYSDMLDNCQKEIDAFYGRYAAKEHISLAEAKKRVAKLDIEAYERKAKRYVAEKNFSKKANEEMRLYNATMKINRLEMLKANIGLELIAGHEELNDFMGGILKGRTEDELKRQAGILGKTIKDNAQTANSIVNASFHNATFSDRVWLYQDLMKADLSKLLQSGLIAGKNPRVLARELKQKFNTSTFNAERLMRTELARVQTEAQKQSYIEDGLEEYEFIVNGGCCPICEGLSGKHFKVAKMLPGTNAPPMHPHCRCSTVGYFDRAAYEAEIDFLGKGGTTAEFEKLKKENIDKMAKSGIIKERSSNNITQITDETISKVPKVNISGYTDEQNSFIQEQHKELLKFARDNNASREVAFVFRKGLTDRSEYIGTDKTVNLGSALLGKGNGLFVMHNHPRNSPCSYDDILEFIGCDEIQAIGIVKNNGSVEVINKLTNYNNRTTLLELNRNISKYVKTGTDAEYQKAVEKTLTKLSGKGGFIEWIK